MGEGKMIKNFLALFGGFILLLYVLGMLGIGNFVLMYSPDPIVCVKGVEPLVKGD